MNFLKRLLEYSIFSLAILLAFLLVFEKFLYVPILVKWIGHWHPLVLHFPIVLVLITIIQYWRKDEYFSWYLNISTFLTLITATTGFLLSLESGSKSDLILTHQWLGIAVSYVMVFWYGLNQRIIQKKILTISIQGVLLFLIVITGHFGGMVTHGQDFLSFSNKNDQNTVIIPDDPVIFKHIIQPILDSKCSSCHNQNKSKGEFVLTDYASLLNGGKSGKSIDLNNFLNSSLLKRISLPIEDEKHMPPVDEKQLTDNENALLLSWIKKGAAENMKFSNLETDDISYEPIKKIIDNSKNNRWETLPKVSNEKIEQLSSNYVSISRIYSNSNALELIIYPHKDYNSTTISELQPLAKNIVELNLSKLPILKQDLSFIALCTNLEKLNISNTTVNKEDMRGFTQLNNLIELKIYNTNLDNSFLDLIYKLPGLKSLYAYNTNITEEGIKEFNENNNEIIIYKSANQSQNFKSVLPSPTIAPIKHFFKFPFKVKLNHPLKNIDVFYTTDGRHPDETSDKALDSLVIENRVKLKYYASKVGWESSSIDSMQFFKSEIKPDSYELVNEPNPKYTGKGKKLLFDLEKGSENIGDSSWMAFNEEDFILHCEWKEEQTINSVVVSSIINTDPYLFPPESIIVRGGMDKSKMKILGKSSPIKLEERSNRYLDFFECRFTPAKVRYIEITVQPLQRIPMWHPGKGKKAWFFIDEVVFVEGSLQ